MCLLVPHHRSELCMMFVNCISLYIWMFDSSFWFMSLVICVYIQKRCDITYHLNIVLYFSTSTYIARSPGSHIIYYILLVLNVFMLFVFLPFLSKPIFILTVMICLFHLLWAFCNHAILFWLLYFFLNRKFVVYK